MNTPSPANMYTAEYKDRAPRALSAFIAPGARTKPILPIDPWLALAACRTIHVRASVNKAKPKQIEPKIVRLVPRASWWQLSYTSSQRGHRLKGLVSQR